MKKGELVEDPFCHYLLEIELRGFVEDPLTGELKETKCAWHLDRHTDTQSEKCERRKEKDDEGTSNPPAFMHPLYHLHFGGRALKSTVQNDIPVGVLLIDAPRIPCPPLEALMGIDFILTNFLSTADLPIRQDKLYINQLSKMQEKVWQSYFKAALSHWQQKPMSHPWQSTLVLPQLLMGNS